MPKFRVTVVTTATGIVEVDVPEGTTDPNEISEIAFDEAEFPQLSAEGSGMGSSWTLELGEWKVLENKDGDAVVEPLGEI